MTLSQQATYAERFARTDSAALTSSSTSDITKGYINDGVRMFCTRTGGIPKEDYLTVAPLFDVRSNFAVRITITSGANAVAATDFVISTASHTDLSAASMAAYLNTQISNTLGVSCTMSWNTASWVFSFRDNASAATYIEFAAPSNPSYVNYMNFLFNKTGTQSGVYYEGILPMDCTAEIALPTDFISMEFLQWDQYKLEPAPYDLFLTNGSPGTPRWYSIKNRRLRLAPYPMEQEMLYIRYKHMPADLTAGTDDSTNCPLPTEYHLAPVHYAAAMIGLQNEDDEIYKKHFGLFLDMLMQYKINEANTTPTLFPGVTPEPIQRAPDGI